MPCSHYYISLSLRAQKSIKRSILGATVENNQPNLKQTFSKSRRDKFKKFDFLPNHLKVEHWVVSDESFKNILLNGVLH